MPISFSTVANDVWNFVKRPRLAHLSDTFLSNPAQVLWFLLLLDFLLMFPLSGLLGVLGVENMDHKIDALKDNPLQLAALAVIMAPILEEAAFRLPMKFSYVRISIALGVALMVMAGQIQDEKIVGIIIGVLLFSVFLYQFINTQKDDQLNQKFGHWWEQHFYIPFWSLTIAFAVLHLSNFGDFPLHFAPFLVLPQFVLGAILGYVRTGFGFMYAVLFHALHNGILVGLAMMASSAEQFAEPSLGRVITLFDGLMAIGLL